MKGGSDCLWALIQSSNIVSSCWNKLWWCRPFTSCLNSTEKYNLCTSPFEILFVLLSKYSNEKTREGKPSLCWRIGQFVNHFLIVNEGLQGSLPRLEGQWRRPVWTEGAEREKRLAVGTLSLRGPPNPIGPLLPGSQSAGAGSWERLSLPPKTLMRV